MPGVIYPQFEKLLFELFNGSATVPDKVYMGLKGPSGEISTTDTGGNPTGYVRQEIATSSLTDAAFGAGWQLTIPTQAFNPFEAVPSVNGATDWFVSDAATGGNTYFSGPLNPGPVSGTLASAVAAGGSYFLVPTSTASSLAPLDYLTFGSVCAGNLETIRVSSLTDNSDGTTSVFTSFGHSHPAGEAWLRDGATRNYTIGYPETVDAAISLAQG